MQTQPGGAIKKKFKGHNRYMRVSSGKLDETLDSFINENNNTAIEYCNNVQKATNKK